MKPHSRMRECITSAVMVVTLGEIVTWSYTVITVCKRAVRSCMTIEAMGELYGMKISSPGEIACVVLIVRV